MPRSTTAMAMQPTFTLTSSGSGFLGVLEGALRMDQHVIDSSSARLRHTDVLLGDATFLNVAGRLAKRLLELGLAVGEGAAPPSPRTVRIAQAELAGMVGAGRAPGGLEGGSAAYTATNGQHQGPGRSGVWTNLCHCASHRQYRGNERESHGKSSDGRQLSRRLRRVAARGDPAPVSGLRG